MEVGSEISQKIRSAIRAKLMELGAYVDDELPEYIMVMVANKRSRLQMNNDLCLFLGTNTSAFTEWLHSLLGKLQTIRGDADKSTDKEGTAAKLKVKKEKGKAQSGLGKKDGKDKRKHDKHNNDSITKRKATSGAISQSPEETLPDSGNIEENWHKQANENIQPSESGTVESVEKEKLAGVKPTSGQEDIEDMRQFLVTEASRDALSEEMETSETEQFNSRTVSSMGTNTNPTKVSVSPKSETSPVSISTRRSPSPEKYVQSSAVIRKRKASSSDGSKEWDEAYNPAVSTVEGTKVITSSVQPNRETDSTASEDRMHDLQAEPQDQYGQPPKKLIKLTDTVHLDDIKQALAEVLEKAQTRNDDEISHFSKMVESSLRRLRQQDLSLAKLRIQQVLFEFESVAAQKNLVQKKQNESSVHHVSHSSKDSKCNSVGTHIDTSQAPSGLKNANSSSVRMPKDTHANPTSLHTTYRSSPEEEENQNSENQILTNLADSDQHIGTTHGLRQKISSSNIRNHVSGKNDCSLSDTRTMLESNEPHTERVIFHPKSIKNLKSSVTNETTDCHSKSQGSMVKSGERKSNSVKSQKEDLPPQSPVSLSKADAGSPSSVHSCPLSNTSGLHVRRSVTSASRESTLSPVDLQPQPGASHIFKSKLASTKSKLSPSILVDSIHNRKRLEPPESASVLRQSDRSPRTADPSKRDSQDSPRQFGPEALKVMAKNLRITVVNKRAVRSEQESSSEDSDDDEDLDSSDDEDEEENNDSTKRAEVEVTQNKDISGHSAA